MKERLETNQIAYSILKTQIEFGAYVCGEHLPPIEEMAELLFVSMDSIRLAYRQLQAEGYITLIKGIGSVVKVDYAEREIEQNIQTFFSEHKEVLLDICDSTPALFGYAQFMAWKSVSIEKLREAQSIIVSKGLSLSYAAIVYTQILYNSLKIELLTNLIHRVITTFMVPFLSLKDCENDCRKDLSYEIDGFSHRIGLRQKEDWGALQALIGDSMNRHIVNIRQAYETRITAPAAAVQVPFIWSGYKKASQICYSIGFELISSIIYGGYPAGSFLPSLKDMAKEKQVSVSTIRHTIALLNDLGIVKTINGVGTQIRTVDQAMEDINFSSPTMQRRLLDCKQSLQLFALSCRNVAALTVTSLDEKKRMQWIELLRSLECLNRYDLTFSFSLRFISQTAPYQTIRLVYAELYKLLFWGVPLRSMQGSQEVLNAWYRPYHLAMVHALENADAEEFSVKLEELLNHQVEEITQQLEKLGIQEAKAKPAPRHRAGERP